MKKLCVAMLLAVVLAAGAMASAKAATTTFTPALSVGDVRSLIGSPSGTMLPGSFTDDYYFQVAASAAGLAQVGDFQLSGRDITNLALKLFRTTPSVQELASDTGGDFLEIAASSLTAGVQYFVRVSGTAGAGGGQYLGTLSIVPVPAALPLMLGALAGLGLIARRKTDA